MANPFNFLLENFALQHVKPRFYPAGRQLEHKSSDYNGIANRPLADNDFTMTTGENGQPPTSMMGTPVFCDLILRDETGGVELRFEWILAEVNQNKNIVKTAIQGRNGTVKEYVSDGDYSVRLRGGLFSAFSRAYPSTDVQTLNALLKIREPLVVVSQYLQQFSISHLVVESYSFPQSQGITNVQLFDIAALSDDSINLRKASDV